MELMERTRSTRFSTPVGRQAGDFGCSADRPLDFRWLNNVVQVQRRNTNAGTTQDSRKMAENLAAVIAAAAVTAAWTNAIEALNRSMQRR